MTPAVVMAVFSVAVFLYSVVMMSALRGNGRDDFSVRDYVEHGRRIRSSVSIVAGVSFLTAVVSGLLFFLV